MLVCGLVVGMLPKPHVFSFKIFAEWNFLTPPVGRASFVFVLLSGILLFHFQFTLSSCRPMNLSVKLDTARSRCFILRVHIEGCSVIIYKNVIISRKIECVLANNAFKDWNTDCDALSSAKNLHFNQWWNTSWTQHYDSGVAIINVQVTCRLYCCCSWICRWWFCRCWDWIWRSMRTGQECHPVWRRRWTWNYLSSWIT